MAEDWLRIVALTGWLVLALWAYRSRRISGKSTVLTVLAWVTIFLVVALVFGAIRK